MVYYAILVIYVILYKIPIINFIRCLRCVNVILRIYYCNLQNCTYLRDIMYYDDAISFCIIYVVLMFFMNVFVCLCVCVCVHGDDFNSRTNYHFCITKEKNFSFVIIIGENLWSV